MNSEHLCCVLFTRNMAQTVAQNLTTLTYGATLGELTSLEELVRLFRFALLLNYNLEFHQVRFNIHEIIEKFHLNSNFRCLIDEAALF